MITAAIAPGLSWSSGENYFVTQRERGYELMTERRQRKAENITLSSKKHFTKDTFMSFHRPPHIIFHQQDETYHRPPRPQRRRHRGWICPTRRPRHICRPWRGCPRSQTRFLEAYLSPTFAPCRQSKKRSFSMVGSIRFFGFPA